MKQYFENNSTNITKRYRPRNSKFYYAKINKIVAQLFTIYCFHTFVMINIEFHKNTFSSLDESLLR